MRILIYLLMAGLVACAQTTDQSAANKQADINYKMAISHLQGNNPTMALKKLLVAVEQDPSSDAIHIALAQAYQQKKSYPNAERHYRKALELSADDPRYLNNIASLYLEMEQWDRAIEYFDKALSDLLFLSPHVAHAGKGFALFHQQNYAAAVEQYSEALSISPRYSTAYYLKGEAYREMGETLAAIKSYERAITLFPAYAQANYQLGILLLQQKENRLAAERLQAVVEGAPNSEMGMDAADILRGLKETY